MQNWAYGPRMRASEWNDRFPVGTAVRYWPISGQPETVVSKTRSPAWELGSGHTVVKIEGRTGGVAVEALEVMS
jgi:hypothetical protein